MFRVVARQLKCQSFILRPPCNAASVAGNSTRSWNSEPRFGRAEGSAGGLQPRALYSPKLPGSLSGPTSARSHMSMRPPPAPSKPHAASGTRSMQASPGQTFACPTGLQVAP